MISMGYGGQPVEVLLDGLDRNDRSWFAIEICLGDLLPHRFGEGCSALGRPSPHPLALLWGMASL